MKRTVLLILSALLLAPLAALHAAETPRPLPPSAGAVVYAPHPHFRWEREADVKIDEVHRIQIARDEKFADIVCDDRLEVVSRFVPVQPLVPGKYWWRVRRGQRRQQQSADESSTVRFMRCFPSAKAEKLHGPSSPTVINPSPFMLSST